jgi:hypothetical protein
MRSLLSCVTLNGIFSACTPPHSIHTSTQASAGGHCIYLSEFPLVRLSGSFCTRCKTFWLTLHYQLVESIRRMARGDGKLSGFSPEQCIDRKVVCDCATPSQGAQ